MVDPIYDLVLIAGLRRGTREVANTREWRAGTIRQGPYALVGAQIVRDRVKAVLRNAVAREWVANGRSGGAIVHRERVGDDDLLARGIERLGKVALQLGDGGHGGCHSLSEPLAEALEIHKEERAIVAVIDVGRPDGSTHRKTVLVIGELRTLLAGAVLEEVIRIEFVVAVKFVKRAVQSIAARFDAHVHHSAGTPAEFSGIVVRLNAKLLRRVDRRNEAGLVNEVHRDGGTIDQNLIRIRHAPIGRE